MTMLDDREEAQRRLIGHLAKVIAWKSGFGGKDTGPYAISVGPYQLEVRSIAGFKRRLSGIARGGPRMPIQPAQD